MFLVRYWLSSWLLSACIAVMPRGRYRDEFTLAVYDLKARCMFEVQQARSRGAI